MSSPPTVSILVANYNGAEVIGPCLDSVFSQQTDAALEVLVHDDASTDDSPALVRTRYPEATLLASPQNLGFCRANNRLAAQASGDYLLLLNNDAWLEPDAIHTLLEASRDWGQGVFTLPQYAAEGGGLLDCGMFMDLFANPVPIGEARGQPVATVMGACLWLPRSLWEVCGGFPEWFDSIGEDLYLCNYARLLGHPVRALGTSGYHHHVGYSFGGGKVVPEGLATTVRRRRLSERNKTYVICLFYPWPLLLPLLPLHLLALLVEGLLLALVKRDFALFTRIYGYTLVEVFRQWPRWWRERRAIQRRRRVGVGEYLAVVRWVPYKLAMLLRHGVPRLQ